MRTDLHGEYHFVSRAEAERIHAASLRILDEIGIRIPHERVLAAAEARGALVDYASEVARFPSKVVELALDEWRQRRGDPPDPPDRASRHRVCLAVGGHAVRALGLGTDCVRPSTCQDIADAAHIANQLDEVGAYNHMFLPRDVPPGTEDIMQWNAAVRASAKPCSPYPISAASVRWMHEMALVVDGSAEAARNAGRLGLNAYISSPLRFTREALDKALASHDLGYRVTFGAPMVVAGGSGPASLAGALTLGNAEALGCAVISLAFGSTPTYGSAGIMMDGATGASLYGDPRRLLLAGSAMDMTRYYGVPAGAFHLGVDAQWPGAQLAAERMLSTMLALFLYEHPVHVRCGIMGPAGSVASIAQMFVDREICSMLNAYLDGIEVTDDTIGLDVIREVGIAGSFLAEEHTAQHMRRELWRPKVFQRKLASSPEMPDRDEAFERARDLARDALRRERHRALSDEQERELDRIVGAAQRSLC